MATANDWIYQQKRQIIPCSLCIGPLEGYTTLPANPGEGNAVTGANVLDAVETQVVPYVTQRGLRQDLKLAKQKDDESI